MTSPTLVSFLAGQEGPWRIDRIAAVTGDSLPAADRLAMIEGPGSGSIAPETAYGWILRGHLSNLRYTAEVEAGRLVAQQENLHRPEATRAALIPIRKSEAWWNLAQDRRRHLLEEQSHHIAIGMEYLPPIARRLHHSRDLGEPFDFLTWFEYAPEHSSLFEDLVRRLRSTEEWSYVDREVDIRLTRA